MGAKQIRELLFVDVETTALKGPESRADAIIEIAAARVDIHTREIRDRFTCLGSSPGGIRPLDMGDNLGWNLGDYHNKGGHFRLTDWSTAIDHTLALDMLLDRFFTDGATIAGQNPSS